MGGSLQALALKISLRVVGAVLGVFLREKLIKAAGLGVFPQRQDPFSQDILFDFPGICFGQLAEDDLLGFLEGRQGTGGMIYQGLRLNFSLLNQFNEGPGHLPPGLIWGRDDSDL